MKRRIIICEDHTIIIDGLLLLFKNHVQYEVVGFTTSGDNLIDLIAQNTPDILLLDLNLRSTNGFILLEQVRSKSKDLKVIILTMYKDSFLIENARKAGANAFLLKNIGNQELLIALEKVYETKFYLSKMVQDEQDGNTLFRDKFAHSMKLTRRELQIIRELITGKSAERIGDELFISALTVDTHRKNIFKKLKINTTVELASFVHENNLF